MSKNKENTVKRPRERKPGAIARRWPEILRGMEIGVAYAYPSYYNMVNAIVTAVVRLQKEEGMRFEKWYDNDTSYVVMRTK